MTLVLTVALAEDNLLVREGLHQLLTTLPDIRVTAQCADLDSLLAAVEQETPDVVVTDIRMPPTNTDEGLRLARRLRSAQPSTGVIVLSQYDDPGYAAELFRGGSSRRGYLLKEHVADPGVLASAIRAVSAGGCAVDPSVVDALLTAHGTHPAPPAAAPSQRLVAVMFTDIVESTRVLAEMGDREWRPLLSRYHEQASEVVRRYGGSIIETTGDGVLSVFESAAAAVTVASRLRRDARAMGLNLRAGIHVGELALSGTARIAGLCVHAAARITAAAPAGDVLVSNAVRDCLAGSDVELQDVGQVALKGLPGSWPLHRLVERDQN
ncbi:MAG: response regulator [Actinobacteria bacterium]|nr:response regulator [Actinomycetota bacterium]MCA1720074.1 response regulator [Actinomycetota bacterium]